MESGRWFTKAQMKQLRRLAGTVWERELSGALTELEAEFRRWRAGDISPLELSDLIHEFHDGINRELWKRHTYLKPPHLVARAVATGTLREDELDPAILPRLQVSIDYFREDVSREAAPDEPDDESEGA
jgi:hypothetical protein